jgi:hypothetical protein
MIAEGLVGKRISAESKRTPAAFSPTPPDVLVKEMGMNG